MNPGSMNREKVCERIHVGGIVQGVGFRPFVYRLAHRLGLTGWVANTVHGIIIEVEGENGALGRFAGQLHTQAPPMSEVLYVRRRKISTPGFARFEIRSSKGETGRTTLVSPDAAVCDECLDEMCDPANRRWRYPFINCTNCGPRYTIILDIPYDRPNTTMASFEMCPLCRAEFENPLERRFHAQPNACPVCGPKAFLTDRSGALVEIEGEDPIQTAGRLLLEGAVVAVKGLGGFHLAADATNQAATNNLRKRKERQDKPFAVMFANLGSARKYSQITRSAERILTSPVRPVVLLPKRGKGDGLARSVAPFEDTYGAMLPYTPLHHLLLEAAEGRPLVMTSGNSSDEPIEIDNTEALKRLSHIADYFLLHDRPIYMRADDSVVQPLGRKSFPVRRSRGYVPRPVRLRKKYPPVLAVGGQLKNTVCLLRGPDAFLSQHVGDIERLDTYRFFALTVRQMQKLLEVTPDRVAYDLHPDYLTTRWAIKESGLPAVGVQHHHAHVVSCMAEHKLSGKVIGISMDGTGYGPDGTLWGGEFLIADERGYQRAGHLPYNPLPGGEAAIRETWRMARSVFGRALGVSELESLGLKLWHRVGPKKVETIDRMIETGTNCPMSSGCGRLFDAVAAFIGVRTETLYEGQPAMELESLAQKAAARRAPVYTFELNEAEGMLVPDLTPMFVSIARDTAGGVAAELVARAFHDCLVRVMAEVALSLYQREGLERVVLSGGVFNNRYITRTLSLRLHREGLRVYSHRLVPPGDGGISLGQAVVASHFEL